MFDELLLGHSVHPDMHLDEPVPKGVCKVETYDLSRSGLFRHEPIEWLDKERWFSLEVLPGQVVKLWLKP